MAYPNEDGTELHFTAVRYFLWASGIYIFRYVYAGIVHHRG